jgi:hypothetical protein
VGTEVTLTGTGFTRAAVVAFNHVLARFVVVSDTQITTTVPVGATSGTIAVYSAGGSGASAGSFSVAAPPPVPPEPSVTSIFPVSGVVGSAVTVTGAGLTGASSVTFNGTPAIAFNVVSDTAITATVPVGATSGTITVTTPGGSAASAQSFTVVTRARVTLKAAPTPITLGKSVRASGLLTPLSLAGSPVKLRVQRRTAGVWVTVRTTTLATKAAGAEFTIFFMHWGTENTQEVTQDQRSIARAMADAGADLILGSHPHCVQPFEVLDTDHGSVPVIYSLGNFVSSMARDINKDGVILKFVLQKDNATGKVTLGPMSYIPTMCTSRGDSRFVVLPADAASAAGSSTLEASRERTIGVLGEDIAAPE